MIRDEIVHWSSAMVEPTHVTPFGDTDFRIDYVTISSRYRANQFPALDTVTADLFSIERNPRRTIRSRGQPRFIVFSLRSDRHNSSKPRCIRSVNQFNVRSERPFSLKNLTTLLEQFLWSLLLVDLSVVLCIPFPVTKRILYQENVAFKSLKPVYVPGSYGCSKNS